jgi:ferredoxin
MSVTVRVNPIACNGSGLCAELFPERISLDDWGYPLIDPAAIPPSLQTHARRAVDACPTLALRLEAGKRPPSAASSSIQIAG